MPIPSVISAALLLLLSQSPSSTAVNTADCNVFWMSPSVFNSVIALELSSQEISLTETNIHAAVTCQPNQATVRLEAVIDDAVSSTEIQNVYLHDTPDTMRTRTLALAVSAAIVDYAITLRAMSGNHGEHSVDSPEKNPGTQKTPPKKTIQRADAPAETLRKQHAGHQGMLSLSVLSAARHLHPAPCLRVMRRISKWRVGLLGGAMVFNHNLGTVYTGMASIIAGRNILTFVTSKQMIGEVTGGIFIGVVHGRGYAKPQSTDNAHTKPAVGVDAEFSFFFNPRHRFTMGAQLYGGWMLGLAMTADNKVFGGFNGLYAGIGAIAMFGSPH